MSKTKIRCNTCGKWFQSANAKEVTCPDCMQKARKEKLAAKTAPPPATKTGPSVKSTEIPTRSVPPQSKPASGGTSHWLDAQSDVKVAQPDQTTKPKIPSSPAPRDNRGRPERGGYQGTGPGGYKDRDERDSGGPGGNRGPGGYRETDYRSPGGYRESNYRSPAPYRVGGGMGIPDTVEQRPRQPMTGPGGPPRGPHPGAPGEPRQGGKPAGYKQKTPKPKPETPPKPKREKIPPPLPFEPTEEQIAQIEARYKELAVPIEFDGIRTQISKELNIPKTAVKKIIKEYREKEEIPSWWDLQSYKGDEEEKAKIKAAYEPHLPLPPVGIHKQIAEEFSLKPGDVYQAIKAIRQEMNLPQFNDPALHGLVLKPKKAQKTEEEKQEPEVEVSAESTEEKQELEVKDNPEGTEEKQEPEVKVSVEGKEEEPKAEVKNNAESHEEQQQPATEITSIETDMSFHKEGDTLEVTDQPSAKEDEHSEPVATAITQPKNEGEA